MLHGLYFGRRVRNSVYFKLINIKLQVYCLIRANETIRYTALWWTFLNTTLLELHIAYWPLRCPRTNKSLTFWPEESHNMHDDCTKCKRCKEEFAQHFQTTYWKLTLSTWNLVSKIPEVRTLHLSRSWKRWAQKIKTGKLWHMAL